MPDDTLGPALQEAYAIGTTGVHYVTLEMRHSLLTEPIRVVCDHEDLICTLESDAPLDPGEQVTFQAFTFRTSKPEISPTGIPTMPLEIDNVDRRITASIEAVLSSKESIKVVFREYLSLDLSMPQNDPPMELEVLDCRADVFVVKVTLGWANRKNMRFPTDLFDSERNPSLAA